jgi:hypothetical protein
LVESYAARGGLLKLSVVAGFGLRGGMFPIGLRRRRLLNQNPGIADDCRATFRSLDDLVPDIWLTHHNELDDFGRRQRGAPAWVNRDTLHAWVRDRSRDALCPPRHSSSLWEKQVRVVRFSAVRTSAGDVILPRRPGERQHRGPPRVDAA